ncbi:MULTISPECIES: sugar transferase [unclassified Streptomyces]|uniref:sugar transferase n=1 Tax=unclassified Streptomyces TaxID=2593676 RepID=UPI0037F3C4A8
MTTESTSVPPPSGRARTDERQPRRRQVARQFRGRVPVAAPRDIRGARGAPDRVALPALRRRTGSAPRFALPLVAVDALAALLSTAVLGPEQRDAVLIVQLIVCVTALNALAGLYRPGVVVSGLDQLPALAARIAVAWCAAAAVLAALFPANALGLTALLGGGAVQLAVACCCRALIHSRRRATARTRLRSALVVGTGPTARRLTRLLDRHPEYGLRPVGIAMPVLPAPAQHGGQPAAQNTEQDAPALPVLTTAEDIHRAVVQNGVQEALFVETGFSEPGFGGTGFGETGSGGTGAGEQGAAESGPGADESEPGATGADLVALFHAYGCATWFVGAGPWDAAAPSPGMERHLWGFPARRVEPPGARGRRLGASAKRLLDLLITVPILLVAAPVLLLCALAVRLCDGPGVLFRQERVGQYGRPFTLLKFRTLCPSDPRESETRWNIANDLRMSPVGNFLRRTSMDELPQLWNVLRGDMSLVGPRPERPYFVAGFSRTHPGYAARHRMPVGITGLAQVHGLRGDTSIEERSRFDNHYIDHWSLWQDVCILVRTVVSLVRPAGS